MRDRQRAVHHDAVVAEQEVVAHADGHVVGAVRHRHDPLRRRGSLHLHHRVEARILHAVAVLAVADHRHRCDSARLHPAVARARRVTESVVGGIAAGNRGELTLEVHLSNERDRRGPRTTRTSNDRHERCEDSRQQNDHDAGRTPLPAFGHPHRPSPSPGFDSSFPITPWARMAVAIPRRSRARHPPGTYGSTATNRRLGRRRGG